MLAPWKKSYDKPRQHIKKQKYYFANKSLSSQSYGFFISHVWMWELDYTESWASKNWCFWTVVLEKTLETPLDYKEIQPEGMMLKLKLQYFGHLMWRVESLEKTDAGRDWGQEEKGMTEDEMAGWRHWLDGRESEWTPGVGHGQGGPWVRPLEKAWRIPWTEKPGELQSMGSQRAGHD